MFSEATEYETLCEVYNDQRNRNGYLGENREFHIAGKLHQAEKRPRKHMVINNKDSRSKLNTDNMSRENEVRAPGPTLGTTVISARNLMPCPHC